MEKLQNMLHLSPVSPLKLLLYLGHVLQLRRINSFPTLSIWNSDLEDVQLSLEVHYSDCAVHLITANVLFVKTETNLRR